MKWTDELSRDQRYLYADVLRIVSIVAIVFLHTPLVIICNYEKMPISWWQIANIYQSAVRFAVPTFIMLSGALLLKDERHSSIDFVLRRRITRILFPLLFFSIVYMFWKRPGLFHEGNFLWEILKTVMTGPVYYHLWFLYLLLGLYLMTPLLLGFVRNSDRSLLIYGLVLWVVCAAINPLSERLIGYKLPFAPIEMSGYVGYFLLGYFLHHLEITLNRKRLAQLGIVVLCAIAVTAIGTYALSSRDHHLNETFYGYLTLNVFVAAAGIFVLVRNGSYVFINNRIWLKNGIRILSDASFGVYLIHILVLEILSNQFHVHSSMFDPAMAIPVTAAVCYAISFIISYGLNQLPFHRFLV
jgi:surface polysaccharide O-acyltransferase-like enzyme